MPRESGKQGSAVVWTDIFVKPFGLLAYSNDYKAYNEDSYGNYGNDV